MAGRFFLDTNVFAYTFDARSAPKRAEARRLVSEALATGNGIISYQVVQECLHFLLRKLARPMTQSEADTYLYETLMPLCRVFPDANLYSEAIAISTHTGFSFYDSLILSAALSAGCDTVITEDLQHGRVVRGVTIRNPFR